eukprot:CAMPEP_0195013000 /NCGR_PEP_ID=MMETSP0326_2-20130528/12281_1 /TAXON_ID=2866 ORGANISM="Crypthecodinium cohnii, Strain Seligo" /NCGR_SAMPLE_ID=MMETSP0326_2 /ASSEMBLY_ACC=CAM_ASM_000348 /LENGTH=63 /DNA_ID=CAMNT_0040022891 /DNA_START=142 /DNA_END=329 /DNA_ORIENTATION=-
MSKLMPMLSDGARMQHSSLDDNNNPQHTTLLSLLARPLYRLGKAGKFLMGRGTASHARVSSHP